MSDEIVASLRGECREWHWVVVVAVVAVVVECWSVVLSASASSSAAGELTCNVF
jgi:hypothetical protein